jgi:hypothetical protein
MKRAQLGLFVHVQDERHNEANQRQIGDDGDCFVFSSRKRAVVVVFDCRA